MTGPEHYQEAERLLADAQTEGAEGPIWVRPESLAAAQVHATLAVAATQAAVLTDRYVGDGDHITAWAEATGIAAHQGNGVVLA